VLTHRAQQLAMKRATGPTATGREGKTVYCVCRKSHENGFMIACDVCDEWFHGKCVNISAAQGRRMEKYVCPKCSERRAAPRQSTTPDEEKEDEEGEEGGGDENENENGDGSQGDDEPLFSDEDSDGWKEEEAYIKTPWYDPETDEVDLEEWKKAIAEAGDLQQEGAALGGQEDTLKQGDETLAGGEEMEVTDYSARKRRFSASSSTGLRRREGPSPPPVLSSVQWAGVHSRSLFASQRFVLFREWREAEANICRGRRREGQSS